jgi:hypothetical protein
MSKYIYPEDGIVDVGSPGEQKLKESCDTVACPLTFSSLNIRIVADTSGIAESIRKLDNPMCKYSCQRKGS